QAFRLKEELMHGLVRKLDDLILYGGTVPRANRLDLSAVHGRAMNVFADNALRLRRSPRDVARDLSVVAGHTLGTETERRGIGITRLFLELGPIDRASIQTGRCSSL